MRSTGREVGQHGQCEAHDMVPSGDDATDVRCTSPGRVIREHDGDRLRLRCVCLAHGLASFYEMN
jgi:hypothetical protein